MKQPRDQLRWVRLSREQRDHLHAYVDDDIGDEIVYQWDEAPDDDGLIRGLIFVGTGTMILLPVVIVALVLWLWLA